MKVNRYLWLKLFCWFSRFFTGNPDIYVTTCRLNCGSWWRSGKGDGLRVTHVLPTVWEHLIVMTMLYTRKVPLPSLPYCSLHVVLTSWLSKSSLFCTVSNSLFNSDKASSNRTIWNHIKWDVVVRKHPNSKFLWEKSSFLPLFTCRNEASAGFWSL